LIVWVLESDSGIKLLYKSFSKIATTTDEDIVSGFLTAFNQFSMVEFHQSLESIEMGGLKWIYILEPNYKLLFVAADTKEMNTDILMGRLQAIKKAFIEKFDPVWKKKGGNWDGNHKIFLPFLKVMEDYYNQWEKTEDITKVANIFDTLRIFQQLLIMLRNIINDKMYKKSKNIILNRIEKEYKSLLKQNNFKDQIEFKDIGFSKESWFNIFDTNLVKSDNDVVIQYLKAIIILIIDILKEVKGRNLCFKYFSDEKIYSYIFKNMVQLKDLNLDTFLLERFLLL
jgi:hypothetical protein